MPRPIEGAFQQKRCKLMFIGIGKYYIRNKTMIIVVLTANIYWGYNVPGAMLST